VLLLVGCSVPAVTGQSETHTARGILLEVVSPSLQQVDRFTLRSDDGQEMTFVTATNFNAGAGHAMTPGHMRQHMALAEAVLVTYRLDSDTLVALSATDASN
jgi:hypothetical protein